jgi:carboxyl-terminal processing protease
MRPKNIRLKLLAGIAMVALATGGLSTSVVAADAKPQARTTAKFGDDTYKYLELFGDVFERVRRDYVEEVTDQQLLENAINGMLTALDPHSGYMPAKGFQDMQEQTRGEFGGLGIEVTMEGGLVKVVSPIDDTPASKAGVQPGDFIIAIDGKPAVGLSLTEAVDKMRGPVNSSITITLRRVGVDPIDVTLTRAVIRVRSVVSRAEGDIGYIRVSSFTEQTQVGLDKAIGDLKAAIGPDKIKGYVVDLRNNPGGLLDQAVSVSDTFLDRGEIVSTRSRRADETQRYNAKTGDATDGKPIVVLINEGSASASEIVAGALQDHGRAILLGTKSFGKGSVQTIIPLARGESAMRLTTARYFTPSGRSIQARGVEPDIEVQPAKVEEIMTRNFRGSEGDLPGALSNPDAAKEVTPAAKPGNVPATPPTPGANADPTKKPDEKAAALEQDYQLRRALDLLQGIALYQRAAVN